VLRPLEVTGIDIPLSSGDGHWHCQEQAAQYLTDTDADTDAAPETATETATDTRWDCAAGKGALPRGITPWLSRRVVH
jgi:hypothetical protein